MKTPIYVMLASVLFASLAVLTAAMLYLQNQRLRMILSEVMFRADLEMTQCRYQAEHRGADL